jgi:HEAT repeat protein
MRRRVDHPPLRLLEKDPDTQVRFEAAKALVERADPTAAPVLVRALRDESSVVKGPAIVGVGKLQAREAINELVGLLDSPGFFGRRLAADSLVEIRDERAVPLLEHAAERGRDRSTRRLAKKTVKRLRDAVGISETFT